MLRKINLDRLTSYPSGKIAHDDGSSGFHRYPPKRRNLQVMRHPRRVRMDRKVRSNREVIIVNEAPRKRVKFAAGAIYGESWQTTHSAIVEDRQAREYWFRGVKYESQQAIEAFINSLEPPH